MTLKCKEETDSKKVKGAARLAAVPDASRLIRRQHFPIRWKMALTPQVWLQEGFQEWY
jgi:hypothetical protein